MKEYIYYIVLKNDKPIFRTKFEKGNVGIERNITNMLDTLTDNQYSLKAVDKDEYSDFDYSNVDNKDISDFMQIWNYFEKGGEIISSNFKWKYYYSQIKKEVQDYKEELNKDEILIINTTYGEYDSVNPFNFGFNNEKHKMIISNVGIYFDDKIKDLGVLEIIQIRGKSDDVDFIKSPITNLNKLKIIDGNVNFTMSRIINFGDLKSINGYANFEKSIIKDLGKLQIINGNAYFENSKVGKIDSIIAISGEIYANKNPTFDTYFRINIIHRDKIITHLNSVNNYNLLKENRIYYVKDDVYEVGMALTSYSLTNFMIYSSKILFLGKIKINTEGNFLPNEIWEYI